MPITVLEQTALMKALHDRWRRIEGGERMLEASFPFGVRQIAPERDAAAAPAERRKTAYFQKKLAIFLAELRSLAPVVNFQPGNNCMLRQRHGIEQPRVGDHFLEFDEIF